LKLLSALRSIGFETKAVEDGLPRKIKTESRMKRLLALQTSVAHRGAALCWVLLTVMSGAALAQTTGTVNPSPAPAESSVKEDVPPGGCMPIGLTASGEIVFPIQCKEFIERERGRAVEQKPAAEEKAAAKQSEAAAPSEAVAPENSKPAVTPVETVASPKRVEHESRERAMRRGGCQHYRTYDSASGTYRDYDGRRRSCR
jgi:hypothetical protein